MDKLSERLEAHANAHASVSPYDDEQEQWEADLRKAVEIVRRVEGAPVGQAVGQSGPLPGYAAAIVLMEDPARIKGQRVRLVREE